MTTKTLDDALRERARKNLEAKLLEIYKPVRELFRVGYTLNALNAKDEPVHVAATGETVPINRAALNCISALDMTFKAIFRHLVEKAEQDEINAFLKSVDDLRNSVDELCAGLPQ